MNAETMKILGFGMVVFILILATTKRNISEPSIPATIVTADENEPLPLTGLTGHSTGPI